MRNELNGLRGSAARRWLTRAVYAALLAVGGTVALPDAAPATAISQIFGFPSFDVTEGFNPGDP